MIVRVENLYQQGDNMFAVDARADCGNTRCPVSVTGGDAVDYDVVAFVQHVAAPGAPALQRMRSGHYVAYVNKAGRWFKLDDASVTELPEPPDAYPYIVFLARAMPKRSIPLGGKRRDPRGPDHALEAAATLSGLDPAAPRGSASGSASGSGTRQNAQDQTTRDRSDRDQSGRAQSRDHTARDRSDRDQSGRDQSSRHRAGQQGGAPGLHSAVEAAWGGSAGGDNRNRTRADPANSIDDPFQRYADNWHRRRTSQEVRCRSWSQRAEPSGPQPCQLCQGREFAFREDWKKHVDDAHGGVQRYRNALFSLRSRKPHVVQGQEWRASVANFSEFYARSATDWEKPTQRMRELAQTPEGLPADERWAPRALRACVFCRMRHWSEDITWEFLAGENCFMKNPRPW